MYLPGPLLAQTQPEDSVATESESFYAPRRVLSFADFLWERGEYERAFAEYQRFLFSTSAHRKTAYALYQLGRCHLITDRPAKATPYFLQAAQHAGRPAFRDTARVAHLGALLRANQYDQFFQTTDTLSRALSSPTLDQRLLHLRALVYLDRQQWNEAQTLLTQSNVANDDISPSERTERLLRLAIRGQTLPRKSPALAAVLSTIVPGLGKLYAGRPADGLHSLLLIGGASWLTYEGFHERGLSSFKGWLFGTVGTVLYAGNIYGSVVAIRLHNDRLENTLEHEINVEISISTRL